MKTTGQIGLALVAIIALVAGVTYLSHYGPSAARSGETTPDAAKNDKPAAQPEDFAIITVPNRKVEWMEPSEGDFEMGSRGYHDFWLQNGKQPTLLGLAFKNCKCTDVEVMVLDEEHLPNFHRWLGVGATTVLAGMQQGPLACVSLMAWDELALPKLFGLDMKYQVLETDAKKGISLPAKGGGIIRVRLRARKT